MTDGQQQQAGMPPAKAQKTTAASVASSLAAPAPVASSSVVTRSALAGPVVVSGYKMPVLLFSAEPPLSQVINDEHLAKCQELGIEDIHREDDQDAQEVKDYVMPATHYMLAIEVGPAPACANARAAPGAPSSPCPVPARFFLLVPPRRHQGEYQADPSYMDGQPDLTWRMRSTLVDWLVGIHWQYKWQAETLLLAVNILDRYLSKKQVDKTKLQLVGATAMLIACKYEQIYTPYIEDFNYLCEEMYTKQQFIDMERNILVTLDFKLGQPSAMTYLRRISKAENYDIATRTIAKYLVESTILSEKFIAFKPSQIAAASILAARRMRNSGPWDATMEYYSNYNEDVLAPIVDELAAFLHGNTRYRAIFRKFSGKPFLRASQFVEQHLQKTAGKI